jgi:hypothetical protein
MLFLGAVTGAIPVLIPLLFSFLRVGVARITIFTGPLGLPPLIGLTTGAIYWLTFVPSRRRPILSWFLAVALLALLTLAVGALISWSKQHWR